MKNLFVFRRSRFSVFVSFLVIALFMFSCGERQFTVKIHVEHNSPQAEHAMQQFEALQENDRYLITKENADLTISGSIDAQLGSESYETKSSNGLVTITGGDDTGLMYGLLDIKEQLANGIHQPKNKKESPRLSFRAIKFNLPWSSYRNSEALSLHYETCRDINYWREFLDMMAENRFNKLTLLPV